MPVRATDEYARYCVRLCVYACMRVCLSLQSPDPGLREAAHIIMSRLAYSVANKLVQDVGAVSNLCGSGMQDPTKEVRLAALRFGIRITH